MTGSGDARPGPSWLDVEMLCERRGPAPGDRDGLHAVEGQHCGASDLRPDLLRQAQVRHVLAVHAYEPERLPAALDVRQRRSQQVATLVADDAHVVTVRLRVQDRAAREQTDSAAARVGYG